MGANENAQLLGGESWAHINAIDNGNSSTVSDTITVLHAHRSLAKRWKADGTIAPSDKAKYFKKIEERSIHGIREASAWLTELESNHQACIIRGRFVGEREAAKRDPEYKEGLTRRTNDLFDDQPLHLLMLDVDEFISQTDPIGQPEQACDEFISKRLPIEFQGTSYHYQLSNSAGHSANRHCLKAHLWFWLKTPYTSAQLLAWAKAAKLEIDCAVFQKIQMHYTAAPIFDNGVVDPVSARSGFVEGWACDEVFLSITTDLLAKEKEKPARHERLNQFAAADPIARHLNDRGLVKNSGSNGVLNIVCPFESEHTSPSSDSSTVYFFPFTNGHKEGNFDCKHAHCRNRTRSDFLDAIGYDETAEWIGLMDDVEDHRNDNPRRFMPIPAHAFINGKTPDWIIKDLWPKAVLAMVYGASGSGKTFAVLDMALAVARGIEWRGHKVKQGPVVYVAAEGKEGLRKRLTAYAQHQGINLADVPLSVIPDSPNFLRDDDKDLASAIKECGGATVVVIDTLAQVTPGGNENSGEDMGKVLARCIRLHQSTGALVVLIHHAGKEESRGARGWSGSHAAMDAVLEITRKDGARIIRVTKQKDGEDGAEFTFCLLPVVTGIDDEGDEITSCVVVESASVPANYIKQVKGKWEKAITKVMHAALTTEMSIDTLIEQVLSHEPINSARRDRRPELIRRALDSLTKDGLVSMEGDIVTLPHAT